MKKIFVIITLVVVTLSVNSCSSSEKNKSDNSINSLDTEINNTSDMSTPTNKLTETQVEETTSTPNPTQISDTDNKNITYKNVKLGFYFTIPKKWDGKYYISESEKGITVLFKPSNVNNTETDKMGHLFSIYKEASVEYPDTFDTVGEPRKFVANNVTYIVGGPTDIGFDPENDEFETFSDMQKDISNITKTIQSID